MNSGLLHRWLALSFWLRVPILVLSLGAGALIVRHVWQRPLQQQIDQLTLQQQQEKKRHRTLLRVLRQKGSLRETEQAIAGLEQALSPAARNAFSLLQLEEAAGNELQSWQPTPAGGEVTLLLGWPQLQAVFHYLSERRPPVRLPQFSLKRAHGRLLLKLTVQYEQ